MGSISNKPNTLSVDKLLIFVGLALLMLSTRFNHFVTAINLPSASLACFFLVGFYLAKQRYFLGLFTISVAIDLASSYIRGSFGDCITPSYPFLIFGYFAVYKAGQISAFTMQESALLSKATKSLIWLFAAASFAFFMSNGSYYTFSGHFTTMSLSEYSARVAKYYLPYVQSPFIYLISALALNYLFGKWLYKPAQQKQRL